MWGFRAFTDAGQGAAGADAGAEAVDGACHLLQDLQGGVVLVYHGIVGVGELFGDEHLGVLLLHPQGGVHALCDAGANVAIVVDEPDFRPVVLHELLALLTHRVRHDQDGVIPADCPHQCQADALVAAGGLDDDGVGADEAVLLRLVDHVQSGAGLDGTTHVQALVLHQHLGRVLAHHTGQAHHGGVPHAL